MPTIREVKNEIFRLVSEQNGLKPTQIHNALPREFQIFDIPSILAQMVKDKELAELWYKSALGNSVLVALVIGGGSVHLTYGEKP